MVFNCRTAYPLFYRTYSRVINGNRETWEDVTKRTISGLTTLGKLTSDEVALITKHMESLKVLPSGRWLWVGGTNWIENPANYIGAYNCSSQPIDSIHNIGRMADFAMQGSGTGGVLTRENIKQIPSIKRAIKLIIKGEFGSISPIKRLENTKLTVISDNEFLIEVGDSRKGWVTAYTDLIYLATSNLPEPDAEVTIDFSNVRAKGEKLKGFGGVANPSLLKNAFARTVAILNKAKGRQMNSVEVCLLIDEMALAIVSGGIRRSAGMRQFDADDEIALTAKDNLWQQDSDGNWKIDPERDALRMANHTRVFFKKPTLEQITESVRKQFHSGEGAIQYAPEAIARASADIITSPAQKNAFLDSFEVGKDKAREWLRIFGNDENEAIIDHRMQRFGLNPCAEIISHGFICNLGEVHLNNLDPFNYKEQEEAFKTGAVIVASLLHHKFTEPDMQFSREIDPIVGVSFTGLFDFFVNAFGMRWLEWWQNGRPDNWGNPVYLGDFESIKKQEKITGNIVPESHFFRQRERDYLSWWSKVVHKEVDSYCQKHNLKIPNRCTTVQPSGCLDKDTIRVLDQGLIYLDELVEENSGNNRLNNVFTVRKCFEVKQAVANSPMELVNIRLKNGRIIRATPDHRFSINGQWINAIDLVQGNKLDYSLGEYKNTSDCQLYSLDVQNYSRSHRQELLGHKRGRLTVNISTPKQVSSELAYFIGALFGNGCLSKKSYRVRFSHGIKDILIKLSIIAQELFGISGVLAEDSRGGKYELTFASKQLFDWLKQNELSKNEKSKDIDRIPLPIRMSSKKSILSFIAGLIDTDGCPRNGSFSIDMSSESFIRNLQQVAESVGLCMAISHNTKGSNFQSTKNIWSLRLSRMVSNWEECEYLNKESLKLQSRPIQKPSRTFSYNPYEVAEVKLEDIPDYSFDITVETTDDNESWYWQGSIKSHNSKSLLTNASPGWHPPKGVYYIRRMTFIKDDPIALACRDYGYNIVPSQSDKDENGVLLNDPYDPRCTEWLVEIPNRVSWSGLPNIEKIDIGKFSALAQFDFFMQVQKYYAKHCTSATIELRQEEIESLAEAIYEAIQNNDGYVATALLARFDDNQTYPRLPFEPISEDTYLQLSSEVIARRKSDDFDSLIKQYSINEELIEGPMGCDSDKCLYQPMEQK